ncbi:MAG: hypothetical protein V1738_00370 [Patescibacteria group bacterium]
MRNTKQLGMVTFFIYPHKSGYQGVCLELNIIEEGKDKDRVIELLDEHARSYIEYICKSGHSDDLLNRPAPKIYWKRFEKYVAKLSDCSAQHTAKTRQRTGGRPETNIPSAMIMTTAIPTCAW